MVWRPKKDKAEKSTTYQVIEFIVIVAVALAAAFVVQRFFFKPYKIPTGSMIPTLVEGQRVIANRISMRDQRPQLGDILVFNPPSGVAIQDGSSQCARPPAKESACAVSYRQLLGSTFIKRVVGMPGDRITMDRGRIIRNGQLADEPFISNSCSDNHDGCSWSRPVVVPTNHYYMIGDNRGNSDDSRFWGPLPARAIIGKAVVTYWPPSRLGPID